MGLNYTEGNNIYNTLVESYEKWKSFEKTLGPKVRGYSEGITQVSLSRGMGHTTALIQLFNENADESFLITVVPNQFVRQNVNREYWDRVHRTDFERYVRGRELRFLVKFVMIDFCSISFKVRDKVLDDVRVMFPNVEHIFIVE